jgi:hypothetical protein
LTELISLLNELKTLEAIAKASGVVPINITNAIDKVLAVLASSDFVNPNSALNVLSDVTAAISDIEQIEADPDVKQFAKQVLTLVDNIRNASKPSEVPASVFIKDVPAAN